MVPSARSLYSRLLPLLITGAVVGQVAAAAHESPSLAHLYRQDRFAPASLASDNQSWAASAGWVLIDGMLGEWSSSLYEHVLPVLRHEAGVLDVEVLRPSSLAPMDVNAERLAVLLQKTSRNWRKPLVVVAHSRGAAEMLLALIRHPELIESARIESVILVQGAFIGSPLASFVEDRLGRLLGPLRDAVRTLVPEQALQLHLQARRLLTPKQRSLIASKVFFVRSRARGAPARTALRAGGLYLDLFHGENDGVLLTSQQRVPKLGQDLGILEGDHFELLGATARPTSSEGAEIAPQAFMRALIRVLSRSHPEERVD